MRLNNFLGAFKFCFFFSISLRSAIVTINIVGGTFFPSEWQEIGAVYYLLFYWRHPQDVVGSLSSACRARVYDVDLHGCTAKCSFFSSHRRLSREYCVARWQHIWWRSTVVTGSLSSSLPGLWTSLVPWSTFVIAVPLRSCDDSSLSLHFPTSHFPPPFSTRQCLSFQVPSYSPYYIHMCVRLCFK